MRNKLLWFFLALSAIIFSSCGYRPASAMHAEETGTEPIEIEVIHAAENPEVYVVSYYEGDVFLSEEIVQEGDFPAAVPSIVAARGILGWTEDSGSEISPERTAINGNKSFFAVLGPELRMEGQYFPAEKDGLFYPLNDFTRSDAVRIVYNLLVERPVSEVFLKDVTTNARCYKAASTLANAGYIALDENNRFYPDTPITKNDLIDFLANFFSRYQVEEELRACGETITRGEAAVLFAHLLGPVGDFGNGYFPDVYPELECFSAVFYGGISSDVDWGEDEGFRNLNGYLYYMQQDGYFAHNTVIGSLEFADNCRYTCGNTDLDALTAEIIKDRITKNMTRDQALRTVYDYVRDSFLYRKRNYYDIGENGWEIDEAVTMFTTGKGNCYNFTAAFWALTRQLGFDSVCWSGLVGVGRDPHSWVEIEMDGVVYIFDPETEMSCRLQEDYYTSLYKMTYEQGKFWSYAREPYPDES